MEAFYKDLIPQIWLGGWLWVCKDSHSMWTGEDESPVSLPASEKLYSENFSFNSPSIFVIFLFPKSTTQFFGYKWILLSTHVFTKTILYDGLKYIHHLP